jgi:hypothetical protein
LNKKVLHIEERSCSAIFEGNKDTPKTSKRDLGDTEPTNALVPVGSLAQ